MSRFFICKKENNTPGVRRQCVVLALAVAPIVRVLHPLCHTHGAAKGEKKKSTIIFLQSKVCISEGGQLKCFALSRFFLVITKYNVFLDSHILILPIDILPLTNSGGEATIGQSKNT